MFYLSVTRRLFRTSSLYFLSSPLALPYLSASSVSCIRSCVPTSARSHTCSSVRIQGEAKRTLSKHTSGVDSSVWFCAGVVLLLFTRRSQQIIHTCFIQILRLKVQIDLTCSLPLLLLWRKETEKITPLKSQFYVSLD
jgi:hypothetical protein